MRHPKGCYGCGRKRCSVGDGRTFVVSQAGSEGRPACVLLDLLWMEEALMAMSRVKSAADSPAMLWVDEEFGAEHPLLYEFLRETAWDDGKPRKTGTILLTVDVGTLKGVLHDRDGKRCAWFSAESMTQLLRRVDKALESDAVEWRKDTR